MDVKRIKELIELNQLVKFYKCKEWRNLRQRALERDNYECQVCKEAGRFSHAECVHHIKEVKVSPELALSLDNIICLCNSCHNDIHDKTELLNKDKKKKFTNEERW